MKKIIMYHALKCVTLLFILVLMISCHRGVRELSSPDDFSFVFMTDIHVQPERNAEAGFRAAIDTVNKINPDFVITGGDLIMDALEQTYGRADKLYNIYEGLAEEFNMPVYNTLGNHEIFGIYDGSGVPKDHPEYGKKMFENRLGNRYESFDHKGWHFMVLDGVLDTEKSRYIGMVDEEQMNWIREDLTEVDKSTPIVLSTHIPLLTVFSQIYSGATVPNDSGLVVVNAKEVIELFDNHNLKIVLQGHLHTIEDIYVNGTHYITGGAVSGAWWTGPNNNFEEGFVLVRVRDKEFEWEYIDYLWTVEKKE